MEAGFDVEGALSRACDQWEGLGGRVKDCADAGADPASQLRLDNQAADRATSSTLAVTHYVRERAWNIARMLDHLHDMVFGTASGDLRLDYSVMYPLMRAALEDSAAITWLLQPAEQQERLRRALRILRTDALFLVQNHARLAAAASGSPGIAAEEAERVEAHMAEEVERTNIHFAALATGIGIDPDELLRRLNTADPLRSVYGEQSVTFVSWKLLSDLSHFSMTMLRHLSSSRPELDGAQLASVSLIFFATEINRAVADAIVLMEIRMSAPAANTAS
ncbi:hypothetical protein [Mycetocola zhujimingii]|nr:hypothetical protein [Mycetocola zhujimingii]